ncbi:MAG: hypothetical protein HFE44_07235 [Oscillospiraceae bacterium]|jgi:hypothetical protein|nr:hypothetical protein [Oscillospiraceae bacterium]
MEELLACALLHQCGLAAREEYVQKLDSLFLQDETDELFLELEFCTGDWNKTLSQLNDCWNRALCVERFGKALMSGLKRVYDRKETDLQNFAQKTYALWNMLPWRVGSVEPFQILSYADDPLSWGGEAQSRELYRSAFDFYGGSEG